MSDSTPREEPDALEGPVFADHPAGWGRMVAVYAALLSLTHLYLAMALSLDNWAKQALTALGYDLRGVTVFPDLGELERNGLHFAGFALLCGLAYPMARARWAQRPGAFALNALLGLAVAAAAVWMVFAYDAVEARGSKLSTMEWIAALVAVFGAIEFSRRAAGWIIPALIVLALAYVSGAGAELPGVFRFRGLSFESVLYRSFYNDEGMFGIIARISSTYVFLFIIFGAFLLKSGAGEFVINLSRAVAGRLTGGPGLVAVMASALTGTISGSAVANTASTGVITIPLMKRAGFSPKFAAGVEASASTGGQLMPPIMGAGAFVMAAYTQISYEVIVAAAVLPAILYFASVAFFVRIEAKRQNLQPMPGDGPTLGESMRNGGASFIIPIALLISLLASGFTPTYAAVIGVAAVIVSSWLTRTPMGPRRIFDALALGARTMTMTAILLCAVGLIVNVIATSGLGNTFSLMISSWSGGNILIAIVLIALASLVLGMGLPVTAAYIVLATLSAPALAGMIADGLLVSMAVAGEMPPTAGALAMLEAPEAMTAFSAPMAEAEARALISGLSFETRALLRENAVSAAALTSALLAAHMIIFWLSQDSNVTPPVCLAAFTAAAIAKAPPMSTGFASWKIAKGLYIVPILFAYTPLLTGDWPEALRAFAFALVGIYALAGALQGWMEARLNIVARGLALAAGVACLWPESLMINLAGLVGTLALLAINVRTARAVAA